MFRRLTLIVLSCSVLLFSASMSAQDAQKTGPLIRASLVLPKDITSDKVQIEYFASGSFGGMGSYLKQQAGVHMYELSVPGDEVKVVAYMPGCQFITLKLTPTTPRTQLLQCIPLTSFMLNGQINQKEVLVGKKFKVDATYQADWANHFFGVADGFIPQFNAVSAIPSEDGSFKLSLPDFSSDPSPKRWHSDGEWWIWLRDVDTGNILSLEPADASAKHRALPVRSSYPDVVLFNAVNR